MTATSTTPDTARDYPRIITPPPGPKAKALVDRDADWTSHCYIKEYPLAVARGHGVMVEDVDGNRYLDFMAGIAVASTGYGHPRVIKAIQDAAANFLHICGSDFYYEGMAALCERLAKIAPGPTKKRVFLTNSGTEATEAAIKLARFSTRRTAIIAFKGAFHGRSTGAVSLTSSKARQHAGFGPLLPDVHHVDYAYRYRCRHCSDKPACSLGCVTSIEEDLLTRHVYPGDVAAVFVEPVQGEGGYVIPPPEFLVGLRDLCDRHGILLVFDEVQSGIGRTGKMFACEHAGVEPDILLTAKGLGSGMPIGAMIARETIDKWENGSHGSTFGGNPVCCAAALATIDLVQEGLMANAHTMGERLLSHAHRLMQKHECIGDVRGLGLMVGVEFVKDRRSRLPASALVNRIVELAFERGLLLLGAGKSALRLAPPLVIDAVDIDRGVEMIDACIADAVAGMAAEVK